MQQYLHEVPLRRSQRNGLYRLIGLRTCEKNLIFFANYLFKTACASKQYVAVSIFKLLLMEEILHYPGCF